MNVYVTKQATWPLNAATLELGLIDSFTSKNENYVNELSIWTAHYFILTLVCSDLWGTAEIRVKIGHRLTFISNSI